ncbi:MAG: porin [Pseudomonadota bacterium]
MKKVLFGTTALVAAAFAGTAMANDIKLSIVGDVTAGVGVGPYSENKAQAGSSDSASDYLESLDEGNVDKDFHIINEAEIQFKAKGTLDNGITIEVRVELEGYGDDYIDENWVKISSSFGSILIGSNDNALDNIAGGIGRMGAGVGGGSWGRDYMFVPGASDTHLGDESDETAIWTLFSPSR